MITSQSHSLDVSRVVHPAGANSHPSCVRRVQAVRQVSEVACSVIPPQLLQQQQQQRDVRMCFRNFRAMYLFMQHMLL